MFPHLSVFYTFFTALLYQSIRISEQLIRRLRVRHGLSSAMFVSWRRIYRFRAQSGANYTNAARWTIELNVEWSPHLNSRRRATCPFSVARRSVRWKHLMGRFDRRASCGTRKRTQACALSPSFPLSCPFLVFSVITSLRRCPLTTAAFVHAAAPTLNSVVFKRTILILSSHARCVKFSLRK